MVWTPIGNELTPVEIWPEERLLDVVHYDQLLSWLLFFLPLMPIFPTLSNDFLFGNDHRNLGFVAVIDCHPLMWCLYVYDFYCRYIYFLMFKVILCKGSVHPLPISCFNSFSQTLLVSASFLSTAHVLFILICFCLGIIPELMNLSLYKLHFISFHSHLHKGLDSDNFLYKWWNSHSFLCLCICSGDSSSPSLHR